MMAQRTQKRLAYSNLVREERENAKAVALLEENIQKYSHDQRTKMMLQGMLREEKLHRSSLAKRRKGLERVM